MKEKLAKNAKRIFCGVAVGVANGLFGGGGGMLAVPLLKQTGLTEKEAHATAILIILPVSAFSFLLYAFYGTFRMDVLIPTAIGVTVGGLIGAELLGKIPAKTVGLIFSFLQLFAGLWLIFA